MQIVESRYTINSIIRYITSEATIFDLQKCPFHMIQPDIKRADRFPN